MHNETVRIVADWLAGVTSAGDGVNALLAGVPRDAGDPVPPGVTVYDATRTDWVAQRKIERADDDVQLPALAVLLLGAFEMDGTVATAYRGGTPTVLVLYLHRELVTEAALTAAGTTLRAVRQSLHRLHANANAAARQRNQIHLLLCTDMREIPPGLVQQLGVDLPVTAGLTFTYQARDWAP